jgi:hypothetical protein
MRIFKLMVSSLCACCALAVRAAAADVDFNSGNELATLFNVSVFRQFGGTSQLTQVSQGGILNSGAVDVSATNFPAAATYHGESFNFAGFGNTLFSSAYFRYQGFSLPPANTRYMFQLGFVTEANGTFTFNEDDMSVLVTASSNGNINLGVGTGSSGQGSLTNLSLVVGHWYKLTGRFINIGSGVEIRAFLDDYGTTGGSFVDNIGTLFDIQPASAALLQDQTVWAGFEANSEGGTDLVDGFSATPEPGATALLLVAFGCGAIGWRTKRR